MQAASIISIVPAAGTMEVSADTAASGKGMHINSGQSTKTSKSLFNKILHQGLTPEELSANSQTGDTNQETDGDQGDNMSMDVYALLAQLNVLGVPAGEQADTADTAAVGTEIPAIVLVDQNQTPGLQGMTAAVNTEAGAGLTAGGETQPQTGEVNAGATFGVTQVIQEIANAMGASEQTDGRNAPDGGKQAGLSAEAAGAGNNAGQTNGMNVVQTDSSQTVQVQTEGVQAAGNQASGTVEVSDGRQVQAADKTVTEQKHADGIELSDGAGSLDGTVRGPEASASSGKDAGNEPGAHPQTKDNVPEDDISAGRASSAHSYAAAAGTSFETGRVSETDKASAVDKAFLQLSNDVRGLQAGTREINIVLEPESLGVLTISVIRTEHGISAKIKSEDRELVSIMSDRLQHLVSSMETKGISVRDVDVVYTPDERGTGFSQQAFSQQRDQNASGQGGGAPRDQKRDEAPQTSFWDSAGGNSPQSVDDSGDTTVEYRV